VTVRMDPRVKATVAAIPNDGWTAIEYTDAVYDERAGRWISPAEVAEIEFIAFAGQKKSERVTGRLVPQRHASPFRKRIRLRTSAHGRQPTST
jgi:hypothetical protein